MGIVQEDGSFELVCGSSGKGAPPGDYDVLIEWKRVTGQGRPQARSRQTARPLCRPQTSLVARHRRGENTIDLPPFELTD